MANWWESSPIKADTEQKWWETAELVQSPEMPEEEPAPRLDMPRGLGVPAPVPAPVVSRADATDEARAERGFGRSAYMDDGMTPNLPTNTPARRSLADVQPRDYENRSMLGVTGDAVKRGALRTASSLPLGMATSDATALQDAARSDQDILWDTFQQFAGADAGRLRSLDVSTPEKAAQALASTGAPAQNVNTFRQLYDQRLARANDARQNRDAYVKRYLTNAEAGGSLLERAYSIPMSDAAERMKERLAQDESFGGTLSALVSNPLDALAFLGEVGVESAPAIATSMATAAVTRNPVLSGVALGAGSAAQEFGASAYDVFQDAGLKIDSAEAARAALDNPALWAAAGKRGATRATVIALFEMMGQGVAAQQLMKSKVGDAVVQTLAQMGTGAGGEAAAQFAAGEKLKGGEILIEGLAEGLTAPFEIGSAAIAGRREAGSTPPPNDRERINSPRLTDNDRSSPIPNDVIDDGKAAVEDLLSGRAPIAPQAGVAPLDEAAPNVITPTQDIVQRPLPTDRLSPTLGAAPSADALPQRPNTPAAQDAPQRAFEDVPEMDGDVDTGRTVRVYDDGQVEYLDPQANQEPAQVAPQPVNQEQNAQTQEPVPQTQEPVAVSDVSEPFKANVFLENEDLTSIEADPETFQYKSGGDAEGVTDRLLGVKRWETDRSGQAIVYEYADGRRVIADGHQRLGLAKRLRAEGQDVSMPVTVFREVDGYKPDDIMVRAALKNVAESDAKDPNPEAIIDAAKVLRARPNITPADMNLPNGDKSALGRNALSLRNLSDEAFGMLVNERASMRSAIAVANAVSDKAAQANILSVVEKSGARNKFEAEMVAKQAAADTVTQTQDSLFGSEDVTETLYLERARVMDQAIKRLRTEASAFKTILRNAGNIEGVGDNRVDRDASAQKAAEDAAAQEYITRLANSKGPISDALTEAARSLKAGGSTGQAVTSFVQAVRSGLQEGGSGRQGSADIGGNPEPVRGQQEGPQLDLTADSLAPTVEAASKALTDARATFDKLDADEKIENAQAYFAASSALSQARDGMADALAERGGRIELKSDKGLGAVITPRPDGKPGARITYFDGKGFSGDTSHDTLKAAVRDAIGQGYEIEAKGYLKNRQALWPKSKRVDVAETPAAQNTPSEGIKAAPATQAPNEGFIIRNKDTGEVVMETRDQAKIDALNTDKYEAVPVRQHLAELNDTNSKARKAAEQAPAVKKASPAVAKVNEIVVPDNAEGTGFYTNSDGDVQIDDLGNGDAEITITTSKTRYRGRAKETKENSQRLKYSEVKESLSPAARAAVEKIIGEQAASTDQTEAGTQTVIPGAEQSPERSEKARDADRKREADVRARQSKMRTGVPQDGPGGLFDTQGDMFDNVTRKEQRQEAPLYVVHNLSEENLRHALDLGGLAAPSLAVARGDIGFDSFGEISLIGSPEMANPRGAGVKAFNADVYSPRQPRAQFDLNGPAYRKMKDALGATADDLGVTLSSELFPEKISREGLNAIAETDVAKLSYLREIGDAPRIAYKKMERLPASMKKWAGKSVWEFKSDPEFKAALVAEVEAKIADMPADIRDKARDRLLPGGEPSRNYIEQRAYTVAQFSTTPKIDTYETGKRIRKKMESPKKRESEYKAWIEDNFADVLAAKFFVKDNGRKRPYKMDEIVKEMTRTIRDGEGWNYGVGSIRSTTAKQFRSLSQIKGDRFKIISQEEMSALKDEVNDELIALADRFKGYHASGNDFGWLDIFSEFMKDLSRGGLREWQTSIFDTPASAEDVAAARAFLHRLGDMPTEYFEIKMQRPVQLSEFEAALVPQGASKETVQALKDAGLQVVRYKPDNEGRGRTEALAKVRKDVLFQRQLDMFYSPLYRAIENAKQAKAPAGDWKAIIAKLPGVKKAETDWLGVEDWLDSQEGTQVTRDDLLAFVRDSQVEIVEDRLGGRPEGFDAAFEALRNDEASEGWSDADVEEQVLADAEIGGEYSPANFETYTEDGGDNYREILLRVPNLHESGKNRPLRSIEDIKKDRAELDRAWKSRGRMTEDESVRFSELQDELIAAEQSKKSPFVQSSHFEQENIVVHARVKDRVGPNGERVLFVEEIQSDLASVWRENSEAPEVTARRRELSALRYRLRDAIGDKSDELAERIKPLHKEPGLTVGNISEDINSVTANLDRQYSNWKQYTLDLLRKNEPDAMNELAALHREAESVQAELLALGTEKRMPEGTPDTPFKEEHTYNLMVKRLLRMAAEEGYDQLSWTPGYMQAERWNSAAQSVVEGIEWDSAEIPGYRYVNIQMASGGQSFSVSVEPSGRIEGSTNRELEGKQLSSLVGPGLAKQIMTEQSGRADNQKITFPDSGYAIAYDQQTKRAVDKLVKKHGTQVRVDKSLPDFEQGLGALINEAAKMPKAEILSRFDSLIADIMSRTDQTMTEGRRRAQQETLDRRRQNLVRALDADEVSYGLQAFTDNDLKTLFPEFAQSLSSPVWSVTITPELREAAMQPMAMFRQPTAQDAATVEAAMPDLAKRLKKVLLDRVKLVIAEGADFQGAFEARGEDLRILIGATRDGMKTLNHEVIHALRNLNLFTDKEWSALSEQAQAEWLDKYDIPNRYDDLDAEGQIEEAIAEAFADFVAEQTEPGPIKAAFAKMRRMFRAVREWLSGNPSVQGVFEAVDTGRVGRRGVPSALRSMIERGEAFLFQKGEKSGKGIRAYHGSPHNFDRFSMDAIGTGEGAQAYGHGLYFAENEAVARGYRDRLTAQNANAAQRSLAYRNGDVAAAIEDAKRKIAIYSEKVKEPNAPDLAHRLLQINKQKLADLEAGAQPPGKMYEVRINANPDDFLDWDAPLSEQRGKAKAALDDFLQWYAGPDGRQEIYEAGIELGDVQNQFDDLSPSQFASAMRARGVPGSKYRDAGSRGRPGGLGSDETRNYVVFDENLIEVVRKYQKAINTTTAAFKRWFGDSKVVDGNGDPLVVYRGMSRDMENGAFRVSEGGTFGDGIYLTSDPEYANIFAGGEGGQVFPVYASIQNPAPQSLVETVEANATAQRRSSRAILEDMGYDGMIAEDGEIVAFRPEQIKSVYNRGTFNPNDARIMYQRQPSARQKVQETLDQMPRDVAVPNRAVFDELFTRNRGVFKNIGQAKGAIGDRVDVAREFMQDRILPLRRAQETIERETGQPISEAMNAYVKEETYHGKVGRRLDDIQQFTIEPIRDLIAESADLDTAKVNDYLTALHAEERNARIAKINPNMPDGGSGMTNAEAQKILKDAKMSKDYPALKEIARLIGDLRDRTLQLRVDAGLMTAKDAELLKSMYKNYVSLKGFEEFDGSEALSDRPNIGRGYSVKGPETKRALGRKSRSFDVLANMLTQAQEVAIRAEKNRVGKAVFDLASQYPSDKLWRVREVETKRVFNKQTGLVETRSQAPTARALADNEMAVKIDGKEYRIEFLDPRLARAMGAVKSGQMGTLMQWLSLPARYFSAVNTMIDPEFVIRNAFRDMQAAQINIRNFGEGDRNAIAKGMIKNWPKAFKAAYQGQKGKTDTEWTKWYREFEEAGAKVSFWKMEDAENMKADLDRQIALRRGNKLVRAGKVMMSPSAFFSTRDNAVLGFIERSNLAVDNAVRLAAYVEARKAGWSKQKAASLSKNLTVNFNRRGHYGPIMNALYPFYNAGMQGTQVLFRAMSNPKRMSKYIVGMIGIGVISDFINAAISDEDDDGVLAYDKLQKHKQEMSFVISTGDDVLTVPMPYGYNVFPYMGTLIGQVMRGVKDPDEAIVDFADAAVSAFSPIYESDGMRTILPMVMDLPYDLATNTDWLHRPIRPENPYGDYGPDAYKFYGGASEWAKGLADVANRATGGTIAEPGMIDISPEYMDHIWGFAAGGAGRFVSNTGDLAAKIISGNTDEIEGYRIPFARQAFSETGHFLDRDRYYRFRDRVNEAKEAREVAQEAGEPLSKLAFDLSKLESEVKLADKVLRAVRKERAAVGPDATAEQRKEWEARESKAILRFNQKYVDIAGASIE